MYGEKVEETQELKYDLQDVKDMYKIQVVVRLASFTSIYLLQFISIYFYLFSIYFYLFSIYLNMFSINFNLFSIYFNFFSWL